MGYVQIRTIAEFSDRMGVVSGIIPVVNVLSKLVK